MKKQKKRTNKRPTAKAVGSDGMVGREQVRAAIDAEEELVGEMPLDLYVMMQLSKQAAEEVLRATVRTTKQGIKARLGL